MSARSRSARLAASLALALMAVFTVAGPAAAGQAEVVVLAVEGGEEAEPVGPDPMPPDATDNPAAPGDYEPNFLWGAAVGLFVLTIFAVLGVAGLYYLLVVRAREREDSSA